MNKYTELNTVQVLKTMPYIVIAMALTYGSHSLWEMNDPFTGVAY